jgi:hypothetical protein
MKRPGQPKFIPTKAQRNQVSALCVRGGGNTVGFGRLKNRDFSRCAA